MYRALGCEKTGSWGAYIVLFSFRLGRGQADLHLDCSRARATIACTKFDAGHCIASEVSFDTPQGKRVLPPQPRVQQQFIADGLSCDTTPAKAAFVIWYSRGCDYADCISLVFFSVNGRQLTPVGGKGIDKFFGSEAATRTMITRYDLEEAIGDRHPIQSACNEVEGNPPTVASYSHYYDPILTANDRFAGNSRNAGDASATVQDAAINALIVAAQADNLTVSDTALLLAIVRHESRIQSGRGRRRIFRFWAWSVH